MKSGHDNSKICPCVVEVYIKIDSMKQLLMGNLKFRKFKLVQILHIYIYVILKKRLLSLMNLHNICKVKNVNVH